MGSIVVSTLISVDGYTEGTGGDVSAMPMDAAFGRHNAERVRAAESLLFGATTFRGMVSYWPHQLDNPDAGEDDRYIARRYADGIPIAVVSDTLTPEETGPFRDQTTIVRRDQVQDAVGALRDQDGDALVFGSRTLWGHLLRLGLVDLLHLMIGPKVVAGDHPAFAGVSATDLELLDAGRMEHSDLVLLTYAPRTKTLPAPPAHTTAASTPGRTP